MRDDTPYCDRPVTEQAREGACMEAVFTAAEAVPVIWEAFGGVGLTAGILRAEFPLAKITACEIDAECAAAYNAAGHGECAQIDATKAPLPVDVRWGASLDFNRFTLLDIDGRAGGRWKTELLDRVWGAQPTWIQITDSAIRYLHLNFSSYGLPAGDRETLLTAYVALFAKAFMRQWGMKLVTYSGHSAATYMLFKS